MESKQLAVLLLSLSLIFCLILSGCSAANQGSGFGKGKGQPLTAKDDDHILSFPSEALSNDEISALKLTLEDEYMAEAVYRQVLDTFGDVNPFSNIINAERKHSDSLIFLYTKYGLNVPKNDWYDRVDSYDSIESACKAGINAETKNAALYDELLSKVDNQDIIFVFTSLRDASLNNHLPAFERCAAR